MEWILSLIASIAMFSLWCYGQVLLAQCVGFNDPQLLAVWCIVSFIGILALVGKIADRQISR